MNAEMLAFLQTGFKRYPEAKTTIAAFEKAMGNELKRALDARTNWSPLQKKECKDPEPDDDTNAYWIGIGISGSSPMHMKVQICCGIRWSPSVCDGKPIIYGIYDMEEPPGTFSWTGEVIPSFEYKKTRFWYLPLPDSLEIEKPLNQLLDALLDQLR